MLGTLSFDFLYLDPDRKITYFNQRGYDYRPETDYALFGSEHLIGLENSSTVGLRVFSKKATGNSATNNAWTGGYTDVNAPGEDVGQLAHVGSAGQRQGFTFPSLPADELTVKKVQLSSRATGFSSRSLKHSVRIGSTDYDQADVSATKVPTFTVVDLDTSPATATAWTKAELDGAEFGVVST